MATPALRALRQRFGDQARIVGIMRPYVTQVLAGTAWLDEIIVWDRHGTRPADRTPAVLRRLRRERFTSLVLLTNSLRAAGLAWLSGAPQRIGYARYGRGPLLTECLRPPRSHGRLTPVSAVDYYLRLAELMQATPSSRQLELATTSEDEREATAVWARLSLGPEESVIALNTGGAYGAAKVWPTEYFAQLARRLAMLPQTKVLVICGPAERCSALQIVQLADSPRVVTLAGESPSIGLSKAAIRRCQLLVTTDSGPRHLAAAFHVPTVTLFGPTDPRWSHNYHVPSLDLQVHVPCGPCGRRTCPRGHHRCMRELDVDQVYRAALSLLPSRCVPQVA